MAVMVVMVVVVLLLLLFWGVSPASGTPCLRMGFHRGDDWTCAILPGGSSFTLRISGNGSMEHVKKQANHTTHTLVTLLQTHNLGAHRVGT